MNWNIAVSTSENLWHVIQGHINKTVVGNSGDILILFTSTKMGHQDLDWKIHFHATFFKNQVTVNVSYQLAPDNA